MDKLKKAIREQKRKLINRVKKEGAIYEDFGQKEVTKLREKYIDISKYTEEENQKRKLINTFEDWCLVYNGE